jgi:hypothetical protein
MLCKVAGLLEFFSGDGGDEREMVEMTMGFEAASASSPLHPHPLLT